MFGVLVAAIVAVMVATLLTPVARSLARRVGAVDAPGGRRVHSVATPRMGGAAVLGAYLAGIGIAIALGVFPWAPVAEGQRAVLAFLAGGVFIALVGVVDDIKGIGAKRKLLGQVIAATIAFAGGARVEGLTLPHFGHIGFGLPLSYLLTLGWVLAFVNAINLIDGLDGLAGGVVFFASLTNLIVALINGNLLAAALNAALAGSLLGFLFYNFNPATVFLGDTGSLFIGYALGAAALLSGRQKESTLVSLLVPVLALGVPLTDTLLAMARRVLERRPVFSPDRGHIHHKLLDLGITHRRAVLILYASTGLLCATSLAAAFGRDWQIGCALFLAAVTVVGTVRFARAFDPTRIQRRTRDLVLSAEVEVLRRALPGLVVEAGAAKSVSEVWQALEGLLVSGVPFASAEWVPQVNGKATWRWEAAGKVRSARTSMIEFGGRAGSGQSVAGGEELGGAQLRFGYVCEKGDVALEVKVLLMVVADAVEAALARVAPAAASAGERVGSGRISERVTARPMDAAVASGRS